MTIKFKLTGRGEFRRSVGITDGYLIDSDEAYESYKEDFPRFASDFEIYAWLTDNYNDNDAIFEFVDDKPIRLVAVDTGCDPEDATLHRNYQWVLKELNKLADRINNP